MEATFQLLTWYNAERIHDIFEGTPKQLADVLSREGFDQPAAAGEEGFAEVEAKQADGKVIGKWRIEPGIVPARCRKPRAGIRVCGKLHDMVTFCEWLADGTFQVPQ